MKQLFILLITLLLISCSAKQAVKDKMPDKITIYAIDNGKDVEQARNRALSFLADINSGFEFEISHQSIEIKVRETEISFIMGNRVFSRQFNQNNALYVAKMNIDVNKSVFKRFTRIKLNIMLENLFENKIDFFKEVLKNAFSVYITKKITVSGVIYITDVKEDKYLNMPENLQLEFSIFYNVK